ncbi:MAG: EAL domain-containing protein [Elusimicrobiaceae bacterium]|nr:EAL domain-containing protein [Elusimicrobiaceae bacterium]
MKRNSLLVLLAILLLVVAGLAGGVAFYWHYIGELLERDVVANVMEAGNETAETFVRALDSDQRLVDTIAITVQTNYPWNNQEKLGRFLFLQGKYNGFENLGIIPLDGSKMITAHESNLPQDWQKEMLMRALAEDTFTTKRYAQIGKAKNVFVQAASLHDGMEPVGALVVLFPTERYSSLLALSSLVENGVAAVISKDGEVEVAGRSLKGRNIFTVLEHAKFRRGQSLDELRQDIQDGQTTFVRYRLDGQNRLLYGVALPVNDWYLVSVLPTDFIQAQAQRVAWVSLALFAFLFFLFGLLGLYIFCLRAYSNKQLFKTAFVDKLTGIDNFNRMSISFEDRVQALHGEAALVIFDILKFKVINDMLGYERGDLILQQAADVLKSWLNEGEHICRSSADNFVLLLSLTDRRNLRARITRMLAAVRRECAISDSCLKVEGVCGVYELKEPLPFYIALDRARLALANAKKSPKENIQFYDEKDRHRIVQERQLENTMEQALADGAFTLMLQPKYDFRTGYMQGAEALVRWNQADKGLVRPDDFIPLFERNGFILKLDMFILEQAVKFLAKWRSDGKQQVPIAVNFSRLHLNDSRYIPQMTQIVDAYDVPHHLIEVELTESVILNNRELAQSVIRGLHKKGFSVAMDDFGSGYSSLNVLKSLQFDSIKLDKEFLSGCEQNPTARHVVSGAVEMIKAVGAKVVAEGVETEKQAAFLREMGCDLAQGYFFSKPIPEEEFEKLLKPASPPEE